jgi:hypothetical protein
MDELAGPAWRDWLIDSEGLLHHPSWRRGFTGDELAAMWFTCQQVAALECRIRLLERDAAKASEEIEGLTRLAHWYRRQLSLEARLGLMIERIGA